MSHSRPQYVSGWYFAVIIGLMVVLGALQLLA